jgi:hypothetical protein
LCFTVLYCIYECAYVWKICELMHDITNCQIQWYPRKGSERPWHSKKSKIHWKYTLWNFVSLIYHSLLALFIACRWPYLLPKRQYHVYDPYVCICDVHVWSLNVHVNVYVCTHT